VSKVLHPDLSSQSDPLINYELAHIGLMVLLSGGDAELFNRICFNDPTLGALVQSKFSNSLFHAQLHTNSETSPSS
jgi:hypothetical protein